MMKKMKNRLKNAKGFTLIELMATLVILALIIAIAVPAVGNITAKAKESAKEANIELVENAAEIAHIDSLAPTETLEFEGKPVDVYTAGDLAEGGYLKVEDFDKFEGFSESFRVYEDVSSGSGTFTSVAPLFPN